jgi:hypothetical protein
MPSQPPEAPPHHAPHPSAEEPPAWPGGEKPGYPPHSPECPHLLERGGNRIWFMWLSTGTWMGANKEQMTPGVAAKNWRWVCAASTPSDMPQEFGGRLSRLMHSSVQTKERRRLSYRLPSGSRD